MTMNYLRHARTPDEKKLRCTPDCNFFIGYTQWAPTSQHSGGSFESPFKHPGRMLPWCTRVFRRTLILGPIKLRGTSPSDDCAPDSWRNCRLCTAAPYAHTRHTRVSHTRQIRGVYSRFRSNWMDYDHVDNFIYISESRRFPFGLKIDRIFSAGI